MKNDAIRAVDKHISIDIGLQLSCPLTIHRHPVAKARDALNARLDSALPIDRFRANVIVDGVDAFFEDAVDAFVVGGREFRAIRRIQRCVMIQTDQRTGERGIEPMRTLREVRSVLGRVFFGRYFVVADEGVVRVGDRVALR